MSSRSFRSARFGAALLATAAALPAFAQPARPVASPVPPRSAKKPAAKPNTSTTLDPVLQDALKTAPKASDVPNANYARLLDLADVTVATDGTVTATYRETIKLFNERARPLAEVNLPYNSSYQRVSVVSARTIKKDGTVVALNPADIRITSPYSDFLMYDDALGTSFSMPGVEDECVIDYTWREETKPLFLPGQFSLYWGFNGPEPVSISRFVLHVPADKPLSSRVVNDPALKPVVVSALNGQTKTYTWEKKAMTPLEVEPGMPPLSTVRTWLEVSSLGGWQTLADWYWKLAQPQAKATESIRATVAKLTVGKSAPEEKARAIYDWVANHTRYVGLEFGLSAYRPHPAGDVHDKLYGDCKDKATLLITMLDLAGIKAAPVLLHAGDRRTVDAGLPTLNAFNHCIALADVGGHDVWLDATAESCAYGDIPEGDRGVQAFVIRNGKGAFTTIPSYAPEENGVEATAKVLLHADGSAETTTEVNLRGAAGQAMRETVRAVTPDRRKLMAQRIAQSLSTGAALKTFDLPDGSDKSGPYRMKLTVNAPGYGKRAGNLLLIPVSGSNSDRQSNPFLSEKRVWPIVVEDSSRTRTETVLTLPEGYALEDLPADVTLTGPLAEYRRTVTKSVDGKTLTVIDSVTERAGTVAPADYDKLRAYYDALLKAGDEQIVLKKVN